VQQVHALALLTDADFHAFMIFNIFSNHFLFKVFIVDLKFLTTKKGSLCNWNEFNVDVIGGFHFEKKFPRI